MRRKIVKQGYSTLMISLPATWAKKFNLDKGNEIHIDEKNENLILSPTELEFEKTEITLDLENSDPLINRTIAATYKKGYDIINVKFKTQNILNKIQKEILSEIIGFEIIEQGKDYCKLSDITKTNYEEFDNILNRIFFIVKNMLSELINALQNNETKLDYIKYMDFQINKYYHFCIRTLNKNDKLEKEQTNSLYVIITILETLGDTIKELINLIVQNKITKNEINLIKQTSQIFDKCYSLFIKFQLEKTPKIAKEWQEIIDNNTFKTEIELKIKEILTDTIRILDNTLTLKV